MDSSLRTEVNIFAFFCVPAYDFVDYFSVLVSATLLFTRAFLGWKLLVVGFSTGFSDFLRFF